MRARTFLSEADKILIYKCNFLLLSHFILLGFCERVEAYIFIFILFLSQIFSVPLDFMVSRAKQIKNM